MLDELFLTSLRRGLTGSIRFDDRGDILAPPITILRISREEDKLPNPPGARIERVVRTPLTDLQRVCLSSERERDGLRASAYDGDSPAHLDGACELTLAA